MGRQFTPEQYARTLRSQASRMLQLQVTALNRTLIALKQQVIRDNLSGPTGNSSVRKQSAKLSRSIITSKASLGRGRLGATVAVATFRFDSEYAGIHIGKKGASTTLRAKRSKFLAIPTKYARSATGRPLGSPRDPRWGRTFASNGIIWGAQAGSRNPRPLFVLRKSVVVPQRIDFIQNIVKPGQAIYKRLIEAGLKRIFK